MSWRSFYDMANPDGDYNVFPFLEVDARHPPLPPPALPLPPRHPQTRPRSSTARTTSTASTDASRCVAVLADALGPKPNFELAILEDADHGFGGKEKELAEVIVEWMEAGRSEVTFYAS